MRKLETNPRTLTKSAAISQIRALVTECAESGWDGNGAKPVSQGAASQAIDLIRALPDGIALPEFAPEPDGSISLDWIQSRSRLFSLSAGPSRLLAYAWLDGEDRGHAVAAFDGATVPWGVLEKIRGIMDHAEVP